MNAKELRDYCDGQIKYGDEIDGDAAELTLAFLASHAELLRIVKEWVPSYVQLHDPCQTAIAAAEKLVKP